MSQWPLPWRRRTPKGPTHEELVAIQQAAIRRVLFERDLERQHQEAKHRGR